MSKSVYDHSPHYYIQHDIIDPTPYEGDSPWRYEESECPLCGQGFRKDERLLVLSHKDMKDEIMIHASCVWVAALDAQDWTRFREAVFCGYGEPTERLDVLLAAASHLKARDPALRIRVNTNGLSDLINGRPTAALFAGCVDCLSISLNTDDPAEYLALCRPKFGADAFPALLAFAREAASAVPEVVLTVVGEPVTDVAKQARCRALAESLGARLRVRPFES